jgi:MoxR-like ATPase
MAESLHGKIAAMLAELNSTYLQGKEEPLRLAMIAMLSGGHLLIEDLPGLGKTTLALALAGSTGLSFGRVQCTSDLLPSDITGLSILDREANAFRFVPGPIFHNIVLLDEINRAMPRTQSAMLEAMEERRVTVEGMTHHLPDPFMVIATQNPSEQSGTYPLPESQLDRFMICTGVGYPPVELEKRIIAGGGIRERITGMRSFLTPEEVVTARRQVTETVHLSSRAVDYIHALVSATRQHAAILNGLSTRAAINLAQAGRAAAFLEGRDFVAPEDLAGLAVAVGAHRLIMRPENETMQRSELLAEIIAQIPLPLV